MSASILRSLILLSVVLALVPQASLGQPADQSQVARFETNDGATSDAIEVALLTAKQIGKADHVLLATKSVFADSLASGAFQGKYQAPLLFIDPVEGIEPVVQNAIAQLGASTITVLGGPDAISDTVLAQAKTIPGIRTVNRIGGESRVETAVLLAERTGGNPRTAIIARADDYADALAAGALAAKTGWPILLAPKPYEPATKALVTLHPALQDYLTKGSFDRLVVAGGPEAVTDSTIDALHAFVPTVERAAGETRVETATALAAYWPNPTGVSLVDGYGGEDGFHAGFTAALLAARQNTPLLVTQADTPLTTDQLALVQPINDQGHMLFCAPDVPPTVCNQLATAAQLPMVSVDVQGSVPPQPAPTTQPEPASTPGPITPPPPVTDPSGEVAITTSRRVLYGPKVNGELNPASTTTLTVTGQKGLVDGTLNLAWGLDYGGTGNYDAFFNAQGNLFRSPHGVGFPLNPYQQTNGLVSKSGHNHILALPGTATTFTETVTLHHTQSYSRIFPMVLAPNPLLRVKGEMITLLPTPLEAEQNLLAVPGANEMDNWAVEGIEGQDVVVTDCRYRRTIPHVTSTYHSPTGIEASLDSGLNVLKRGDVVWVKAIEGHQSGVGRDGQGTIVYAPGVPSEPFCPSPLLADARIASVEQSDTEIDGQPTYRVRLIADQFVKYDPTSPAGIFEDAKVHRDLITIRRAGAEPSAEDMKPSAIYADVSNDEDVLEETKHRVKGFAEEHQNHGFVMIVDGIEAGVEYDLVLAEGALEVDNKFHQTADQQNDQYPTGTKSVPLTFRFRP